jgi:hypothetical protein
MVFVQPFRWHQKYFRIKRNHLLIIFHIQDDVIHQTFHIRSLRKSHNAPASPAVNRNKKQWSLAQNRKKLDGSLHAFVRRVICHIRTDVDKLHYSVSLQTYFVRGL